MTKNNGIKHLIECHCILPQFKKKDPAIYHKFTVYSKINESTGAVEEKYSQCNNCGTVHKVIDICRSEIVIGKDEHESGLTIEEMSIQIDQKISNLLSINNCDYATWEQVIDIIDNERWEESIIIKRDIINDREHVKILKIMSETKIKLYSRVIEDEIIGEAVL